MSSDKSNNETILVIEDDAGIAELEQMQLERAGFMVLTAASSEEALDLLRRQHVDLLLLDYRLSGNLDGLDFYLECKKMGFEVPVILVTGFSNEGVAIRALRAGVRDLITKSAEYLDYLPEAVERVLRQVRTERRLAESEARLTSIIDSAHDAIIIAETGLQITLFNKAAEAMFRCSASAALGQPVSRFIPQDERKFAESQAGQEPLIRLSSYGTRGVRTDGTEFPLELSVSRTAVGGRSSYTVIVRDITERKRVEEEERELNAILERRVTERTAELESMLASATIGLSFFDREVRFLRVNHCLARINGIPAEAHLGRPLRELLPEIAETVEPIVRQIFETGRPVAEIEIEGTTPASPQERRYWLQSFYPVPGADGTVVSVGAAVTEITDRKQMESVLERRGEELAVANAELTRAARLKDEFLASMSHELRTPLNGILGISEVLQERVYGPLNEKQLSALGDVVECGRHLLALINDILDVAKIEAGKVELEPAPVAVDQLCQASLRMVKEPALKKRISVSLYLDKSVRGLTADERRLKQVLVNLLSNAVKFTAEGGQVGLDVVGDGDGDGDGDGGQVRLTVWDTGIGIAPEELHRLFEPFVQLDSRLSRQYEGTGLGLALVKRLTELHGGRVVVESQPGQGSRFTIVLPWTRELPALEATEWPLQPPEQSRLQQKSQESPGGPLILVVDDKPQNTRGLVDYLIFKGYRVACATSGIEGIELAQTLLPEMILMDIQMPHVDGWEAIRRIRLISRLRKVPIIAVTALAMPEDRERSLEAGATEYISKPVSLDQLRQVIESLLNP